MFATDSIGNESKAFAIIRTEKGVLQGITRKIGCEARNPLVITTKATPPSDFSLPWGNLYGMTRARDVCVESKLLQL